MEYEKGKMLRVGEQYDLKADVYHPLHDFIQGWLKQAEKKAVEAEGWLFLEDTIKEIARSFGEFLGRFEGMTPVTPVDDEKEQESESKKEL